MPDFKLWDSEVARATCNAPDYPDITRKALVEMHRQVGDLTMDGSGIAVSGLLIRHLALPGGRAGTSDVMGFIAKNLSRNSYVNVMAQYRPVGNTADIEALSRPISRQEFETALLDAINTGLTRSDGS